MTKMIKLGKPHKIDGKEVAEVAMRVPKVRDMEAVNPIKNDATREMTLISNLTNVTLEDLREMDLPTYLPLQEAVMDFLSPTQKA